MVKQAGKLAGKVIDAGGPAKLTWAADIGNWIDHLVKDGLRRIDPRYRHFDDEYRKIMLRHNRILKHAIVLDLEKPPEIEDVYVDLALVPRRPSQVDGGAVSRPGSRDETTSQKTLAEVLEDKPVAGDGLKRFHDGRQLIVLLGGPGSGKTISLQHLLTSSLGRPDWPAGKLPVLLQWQDWAGLNPEGGDSLIQVIESDYSRKAGGKSPPPGWVQRRLDAGGFLVMFDGLDNIASADDRRQVITWLSQQADRYGPNHYLVTSRPHAYPENRLYARVFQTQDLTQKQVGLLAHKWLSAVSKDSNSDAKRDAENLLTHLARSRELTDLATNPLLLTLTIEVDRSPAQERKRWGLPETRADLYAEVCRVLLDQPQPGAVEPGPVPTVDKGAVLQEFAFLMMESADLDLSRDEAVSRLAVALGTTAPSVTPSAFLNEILATGLLVHDGTDYGFAHRTFQEYLAAACVDRRREPGLLTRRVDDPWWRETILLYAAQAGANPIVEACLNYAKAPARPSATIAVLTLALDCGDLDPDLDHALRDKLDLMREDTEDGDPDDRKIAAALEAWHQLAREIQLRDGTKVCEPPVSRRLYQRFMHHRGIGDPVLALPFDGDRDEPATGVTAVEAADFVDWMNSLDERGPHSYRLPSHTETRHQRFWDSQSIRGHGVWTASKGDGPDLCLSVEPGTSDPYEVTLMDLRHRSAADRNDRAEQDLVALLAIAAAHAIGVADALLAAAAVSGRGARSLPRAWRLRAQQYAALVASLLSAGGDLGDSGLLADGNCLREAARSLTEDQPTTPARAASSFALERARDLSRDVRAMRDCVPLAAIPGSLPSRRRWERLPEGSVQAELTRRIDGALDTYLSESAGRGQALVADLDLDLLLCVLFARDAEPARGSRQLHDLIWGKRLDEIVEGWLPRSVVPELLRRRARDGQAKVNGLTGAPEADYIRGRMAAVAGQIAGLVSRISEREPVDPLLAAQVRLRALTVASCACWLDGGREVAEWYVDIAAGVTALEQRSASQATPSEVIVLVRVTKKEPSRRTRSRRRR
ncbi:MAG TPA: NACHT domain-containing protein [Trebonia sp.]|nr:NACHT domain-containing protein [Trebonia sp.]